MRNKSGPEIEKQIHGSIKTHSFSLTHKPWTDPTASKNRFKFEATSSIDTRYDAGCDIYSIQIS